jgi:hypothetical protein
MDRSFLQGMVRAHVFNPALADEGRKPLPRPKPKPLAPEAKAPSNLNNSLSFFLAVTNTRKP